MLIAGCASTRAPTLADTGGGPPTCPWVASASGTTGKVGYVCDQLACDKDNTFRCEFHNLTSEMQPGPAIKIVMYSEASHAEKFATTTIYSRPLPGGESDVKWLSLPKATVAANCGRDLRRCVFLTEQDRGLYIK